MSQSVNQKKISIWKAINYVASPNQQPKPNFDDITEGLWKTALTIHHIVLPASILAHVESFQH